MPPRHPPSFGFGFALLCSILAVAPATAFASGPLKDGVAVHGWTFLSGNLKADREALGAARSYDINHLELSSKDLLDSLAALNDPHQLSLVRTLTDEAHAAGISEVVYWEHTLNKLEYYPTEFRTGPEGTIDLDNPKFWEWLKQDYRHKLDLVPNCDGLVLTFVETGAEIEKQYSKKLTTNQEKIAFLVESVADVVINERKLNLYARTFGHRIEDYDNIVGAVKQFKNPKIRLLIKEVPHDFFLTHPNDPYAGTIDRPTVIEFDACGEYNGQGTIANAWPQYVLRRWSDFMRRPHIIGYTGRMDRNFETQQIGKPGEINFLALQRGAENPNVSPDAIYDEFITRRYGAAAVPEVKAALKNSEEIIKSVLYYLGLYVAKHSELMYEPYSSYIGMCSGRWIDPPVEHVAHGVDRDFHYWKDVVDHLAPPFVKARKSTWDDALNIPATGWVHPDERMDEQYLRYIITEKNFGVKLVEDSLQHIENARPVLSENDYQDLHDYFERTLLTARLHRAAAAAYFGFRTWCRGKEFQTDYVRTTVRNGLKEIDEVSKLMKDYQPRVPKGAWDWRKDALTAQRYAKQIKDGWPMETKGFRNENGGMKFPD